MTNFNKRAAGVALGGLVAVVASCDFDVTNPGPVQEQFLAEPAAQPALVAGMGRALAQGMNWLAYTSAAVSREIHPSGSTGSFGITQEWQRGELNFDEVDTHWEQAQRARWLAENGIQIITESGESEPGLLAQANLWAGYANRTLGEFMCEAVIDGGSKLPSTEFLNRAEANFTAALGAADPDVAMAAMAGRAAVRAQLGDWSGALADAASVPDDFSYMLPYYDTEGDDTRNRLQFASAAEPYKAHSAWNTWYQDYGLSDNNPAGDARMPYTVTDETGDAATVCCGQVDWWPQTKYADSGADIELSSGVEMRLLEAENLLMTGDWSGAMVIVNALRAAAGVADAVATTEAEAWSAFMREHGIEMWLEGRRLPAFRRWTDNGVDMTLRDALEQISPNGETGDGSHLIRQDLCFPVSESEIDTNTNVTGP